MITISRSLLCATAVAMMAVATLNAPATTPPTAEDAAVRRTNLVYEIADVAFSRLMMYNCYERLPGSVPGCHELTDVSAKDVRLYFGGLLPNNQTVIAVLPESNPKINGREHHAFLVLDPFPAYKFGHPVFMFLLDVNVTLRQCEKSEGIYAELIDNSTICMQMVHSPWCNERPMTSSWDCQVRLLPIVVPTKSQRQQADNMLECWDEKDSFLMNCPNLRNDGTELTDLCNHIKTNIGGCDLGSFQCSSEKLMNQAALMFGGWSRSVADFMTTYDLTSLRDRLVSWGFAPSDIRTFFANGFGTNIHVDEDTEDYVQDNIISVEPADRQTIRKYIKGVCGSTHGCNINTFFLYMANPTRRDGSSLFWDANNNGIVDVDEAYTPREFLHDISLCSARRVIVFLDQSYSGIVAQHAQNLSARLPNVMIIPTTNVEDWTPRHSFASYIRESNKHACLSSYVKPFQESQVMPPVFSGPGLDREIGNITVTGVKCAAYASR